MRFAIIGNSGSGKSTLAKRLATKLGVTPIDLDEIYWEPTQPGVPRSSDDASQALQARLHNSASWIIEGCYETLIHTVLHQTPVLIWLDPGVDACLRHCEARPWEPHKYPSQEAQDANLLMLFDWVRSHYSGTAEMSHHAHAALFNAYRGTKKHALSEDDLELDLLLALGGLDDAGT